MESRQPVHEGTLMGAGSLEHTTSSAALKCHSRKAMQLNMHCRFMSKGLWSLAKKKMQQQVRASLYALFSVNRFL